MNVELLEKVKQHILEEPKRLWMGDWAFKVSPTDENAPACGTVGCIAGWASLLSNPTQPFSDVANSADDPNVNNLDLDEDTAWRLFYVDSWPVQFVDAYDKARGDLTKRAEITAARIEHFIKTKGAE